MLSADDDSEDDDTHDIPEWAGMYWRAFDALRDDRHYGAYGGLSRIWFTSIKAYADQVGISEDDFDLFHTVIRALDDEFVAVETERQKEEAERLKAEQQI